MRRQQSRSDVQQTAEIAALQQLNRQLGLDLQPCQLPLAQDKVHVDGYAKVDDTIVLAKIWAHIGPAKSAQRNKVLTDVLKLAYTAQMLREQQPQCVVRPYVVFIDDEAAQVLRNRSWGASAARMLGIETIVVAIDPALIDAVKAAQKEQDLRAMPPETMIPGLDQADVE